MATLLTHTVVAVKNKGNRKRINPWILENLLKVSGININDIHIYLTVVGLQENYIISYEMFDSLKMKALEST